MKAKNILFVSITAIALNACGDSGSKIVKAAAKAVLADEASQPAQQIAPAAASQTTPETLPTSQTAISQPQYNERIIRKNAVVVTQQGSNVIIRQLPSKTSRKVSYLYDSERVLVTGETSQCETIGNLNGCWVKVLDNAGTSGYVFNAFLQY